MSELVTSRQNSRFKALRDLAEDPRAHGMALADGFHLVELALGQKNLPRQLLVSVGGRNRPEVARLLAKGVAIECLTFSDVLFRDITGIANPVGIAAVIDLPKVNNELPVGDAILLEAVQDAGNVGTILRAAAAAGIRDVLLGPGCAGAWSLRVLRAAQGAHFSLTIREQIDLAAAVRNAPVDAIATVARGGDDLYGTDISGPAYWMFGNEGAGLSSDLSALASRGVTIPLATGTESLNVAAAAAVCLFEQRRQRLEKQRPAQGGP